MVDSLDNIVYIHRFALNADGVGLKFSKVDGAQDDGFCFSPDGRRFINIERQKDSLHSAISVYDTKDFSLTHRLFLDKPMMISHIEYDASTDKYYVLGFMRGTEGVFDHGFVAKFEDFEIKDIVPISTEDYDFYRSYKHLQQMGFTEKAYAWSYMKSDPEELKAASYTLGKLYTQYTTL